MVRARTAITSAIASSALALAASAARPAAAPPAPPQRAADRLVSAVNAVPTATSLAAWHDLLGSEPHEAGTPGDAREIARLRDAFVAMGLSTSVEEFDALLPQPIDAVVEIVGGVLANSLAIATDAAHLLTDFASFMISLFSLWVASRPATR